MKTVVSLLLMGCLQLINTYSIGPTNIACGDMRPRHQADPQMTAAPYTITIDRNTYRGDQEVTVTIQATQPTETPFKGFFVQARRNGSTDAIGQFGTGNDTEIGTITCHGGENNAISHKVSTNKTSKTFTWRNAAGGDVYFQGTFVNVKTNFWMNVRSDPLRQVGGGATGGGSGGGGTQVSSALIFFLVVMRLIAIFT